MVRVAERPPRYFSPAEAEALLPEVDRLLQRAQELLAEIEQSEPSERAAGDGRVRVDGRVQAEPARSQTLKEELYSLIAQIQTHGIVVRDIRSGLIDFPSLREGVEVFLCWKRGEALRIEWWHPTTTGIAGRRRLDS